MRNLEFPYTAHIAQIEALWAQHPEPSESEASQAILDTWITRCPAAPESFHQGGLLFVGINPSLSNEKPEKGTMIRFPHFPENNPHPYFREFEKALDLKRNPEFTSVWQSMDLLFIRETSQSSVETSLVHQNILSFIFKQLMISVSIIESISPKVIVVANTLARRLVGFEMKPNTEDKPESEIWMGYRFKFNEDLGTHVIKGRVDYKGDPTNTKLENTPVFFTSMLSGQRALDIGSRERLMWHIRRAWNYRIQKENPTATNQLPKE